MMGLRKEVESGDRFDGVSRLHKTFEIAGEYGRFACDIGYVRRGEADDVLDGVLFGARSGRVKKNEIDVL